MRAGKKSETEGSNEAVFRYMRKLIIAIIIAAVFGGGWGLLYFVLG